MQGFGQGWDKPGGQPDAVPLRCAVRSAQPRATLKGPGDLWPPVAFSAPAAFSIKADDGNGKVGKLS